MSSDEIKMILERLGHIETGIRNLGARMEAVENRIERLETAFRETIPLWAAELREETKEIREEMKTMREEMQQGFRFLNKKFELVHEDVTNVRAEQRLLEKDFEDLKKKVS
ncbi:MAG: hypothetical protein AB1631_33975 [Acidobacteriota bacterium]